MRKATKIINRTAEPMPLCDVYGEVVTEVPPNGGMLQTFSDAQVAKQRAFAGRVTLDGNFVKCMVEEQKIIEMLKDDLPTYYALNIMKHYLLFNHNILVKTIKNESGEYETVKFTAKDLGEKLGQAKGKGKNNNQTRQTGSRHIKKLKELNIVQPTWHKDYGKVFAINPEYYMNGSSVPKEIWELFDLTKRKDKNEKT